MLDDFWLLLGLTVLVVAIRLVISYLQVNGHLPQIWLQSSYDSHENSVFFWLLLVGKGCLLAGSQEYIATGFLYNYFFRDSTAGWGLVALLASGLIFALLNFTAFIPLFVINTLLGMLFAWAYLATHSIAYPLYLAILNGVLQVILL